MSPKRVTHPRLMNRASVCSEMPSTFTPSFDTKRANFFSFLAAQAGLVQCRVRVPLASLVVTKVGCPHTGHCPGICNSPTFSLTLNWL